MGGQPLPLQANESGQPFALDGRCNRNQGQAPTQRGRRAAQELGQGQVWREVSDGQRAEDAPEVVATPAGWDEGWRAAGTGQPDGAAFGQHGIDEGRGEDHRILLRRVRPLTDMHAGVQVQDDPDIARRLQVKLLDVELVVFGAERPVDSAQLVAWDIVTHARSGGGALQGAAAYLGHASGSATGQLDVRQARHGRVDDESFRGRIVARRLKEAKRVAKAQPHRSQLVYAAPRADHIEHPALGRMPTRRLNTPRGITGQRRLVLDLDPQEWQRAPVDKLEVFLHTVPHLRPAVAPAAREAQPGLERARPAVGQNEQPTQP